jgi:nucleotide-binding universal stress UspA family protein
MSSRTRLWFVCLAIPLVLWIVLACLQRRRTSERALDAPTRAIALHGLPGPDARAVLEDANAVLERHGVKVAATDRVSSVRKLPESFRSVAGAYAARAGVQPELRRLEMSGSPAALRAAIRELGARAGAIIVGTEFELGGDFQTLSAKLWLWI